MKSAKQEVIEVSFKGEGYLVSIVEKQNDSGIMFNDRVFFLLPDRHIGYLSEVKIDDPPERLNFEKAKIVIPITQVKTTVVLERELHIKLLQMEGSKKFEKDWVLRMSSMGLAKKWYDILHAEKIKEIQKKSPTKSTPKNDKNQTQSQFRTKKSDQLPTSIRNDPSKSSPPKKVLQITRSQSLAFILKPQTERMDKTEKVKKVEKVQVEKVQTGVGGEVVETKKVEAGVGGERVEAEKVEAGVGGDRVEAEKVEAGVGGERVQTQKIEAGVGGERVEAQKVEAGVGVGRAEIDKASAAVGRTPASSEMSFKHKPIQTKETGTYMSQRAESIRSVPPPPPTQKKAFMPPPSLKQVSILLSQKKASILPPPSQKKASIPPQEERLRSQIKPPQESAVLIKASKQPYNQGKSDRSFAEMERNKSVRSEPVSRNVEPFMFKRRGYEPREEPVYQAEIVKNKAGSIQIPPAEPSQKQLSNKPPEMEIEKAPSVKPSKAGSIPPYEPSEKQISVSKSNKPAEIAPEKTPSVKSSNQRQVQKSRVSSVPPKEIPQPQKQKEQLNDELALSNKRYISQQQFQKLNTSTPIDYLERTSKLIHSSTSKLRLPESPKASESSIPRSVTKSVHPGSLLSNEPPEPPSYIPISIEKPRQKEQMNRTVPDPKPAKLPEPKPSPTASNHLKFSIPELGEEEDMNDSQELHRVIKDEFSSINRESQQGNEEAFISELPLPWTYRYLEGDHRIFQEFLTFTKDLLEAIVEDMRLPVHKQVFKLKFMRNGIRHYEIDDVEAKVAMISIEELEGQDVRGERVCNRTAVKLLKNQFNNFHLLYQHLPPDSRLKVPLISLCETYGFVALFKTLSVSLDKQMRMRDLEGEMGELRIKTKIKQSFHLNHGRCIIQLDEKYYKAINPDSTTNFKRYFIQEIQEYLPRDCFIKPHSGALIRKELIGKYADPLMENSGSKSIQKLHETPGKEAQRLSDHLLEAISEAVIEIQSLSVYFLSSLELAEFFHQRGINLRYLGQVYRHVTLPFQRRVLMSQMAARCCKALLRKTLQDIVLEENCAAQTVSIKLCDFLNCVTGNNIETATLWKVLSAHSRSYFGVELNFEQIERGYFLAALVENCRLRVAWERLSPQDVFKESILFTQKNLAGVETLGETYLPHHQSFRSRCLQILKEPHSEEAIPELKECLQLAEDHPALFGPLAPQAKLYLSLFLSPLRAKSEIEQVTVYPDAGRTGPSRGVFDLLLMAVKWQLKSGSREGYIKSCDEFIGAASKFFGEFHPVFSELYDVFSAYHQGAGEFQDAITFAKSSLVNVLKVCGTAHQRTSECYYNLALCHIKAGRKEEAFAHINKARAIFESSGQTHTVPYAAISLKLALIYLNQDHTDLCLTATLTALEIFARQDIASCQDELVDCFEMAVRCYQILGQRGKIDEIAERCEGVLGAVTAPHNLERLLKIIVYPILSQAVPEQASLYLDLIAQLPSPSQDSVTAAFQRLRVRIGEGTLLANLNDYLTNLPDIERYLRQANLLQEWESFGESYPRETINDFLALTEELMALLGEGFVNGSLREAL